MAPRTIDLNGSSLRKEANAGGTITPGYLLARSAAGVVVAHAAENDNAGALFALEHDLVGRTVDQDYASGDVVQIGAFPRGGEVYALVAASAVAIVVGNFLESHGDGTLQLTDTDAATDDTQRAGVIAQALEAVDNSGGGSEARIRVEIL